MPRTRKTIVTEDCLPTACSKEQQLGKIEAKIETHDANVLEIKNAVNQLVVGHDKDKRASQEQILKITGEISKMSAALTANAETNKTLLENQNRLLEELNKLVISNQNQTVLQQSFDATMKQHITETSTWKDDFEKRLVKLETSQSNVTAIGAFLISALTAIAFIVEIATRVMK